MPVRSQQWWACGAVVWVGGSPSRLFSKKRYTLGTSEAAVALHSEDAAVRHSRCKGTLIEPFRPRRPTGPPPPAALGWGAGILDLGFLFAIYLVWLRRRWRSGWLWLVRMLVRRM
ncbi:hypothetical protein BS50DRAFT_385685 [Corynespora cassiicola Philippines]|uniref:Uncharacterized protein n=1 Tax=Corynespora cassiicola Philippines TaxID=1448308 RepID=A0A2T2NP66_CORCC|nr:hypothetical protein BS50DRAFT_385685 [Corynespora cassiicola Philippines]